MLIKLSVGPYFKLYDVTINLIFTSSQGCTYVAMYENAAKQALKKGTRQRIPMHWILRKSSLRAQRLFDDMRLMLGENIKPFWKKMIHESAFSTHFN